MSRLPHTLDFPLLVKELNEQAARPRTYIVRIVYGLFVFTLMCVLFYRRLTAVEGISGLGRGREMFDWLIQLQFGCVYLFLPVMACGVLTSEKERNTLGLLLVTSLRPSEILLQKLFGRLIPMLSFLLLSMPLMAVAYTFGGVTETQFWAGIGLVLLTMLQVGSVALVCSAFFRTTTEAFLGCVLLLVAFGFCFSSTFGPGLYADALKGRFDLVVIGCWRSLLMIGIAFSLSWHFLTARAFVTPRNALLMAFKRLDAAYKRANDAYTGGIVLVNDDKILPDGQPVAWRETRKKSLGTVRYLFRVLVVLEVPLLFSFQLLRGPGNSITLASISGMLFLVWGVGAALLALHAGSLISTERSRESLDVLLSTPMTGREILRQKMRGVWRLFAVLTIPLLSVYVFEEWWRDRGVTVYFAWSVATMLVYLPFVAWCGLALGLRSRSQLRTLLLSIVLLVLLVAVPTAVRVMLPSPESSRLADAVRYLYVLSPADVILSIESKNLEGIAFPEPLGLYYGLSLALYAGLTLALRHYCLTHADKLLGRQSAAASAEKAKRTVRAGASFGAVTS